MYHMFFMKRTELEEKTDCHLPTYRSPLSCERVLSNSAFSWQPRAHPLGLRRPSKKWPFFCHHLREVQLRVPRAKRPPYHSPTLESLVLLARVGRLLSGGACAAERKEAGKGMLFCFIFLEKKKELWTSLSKVAQKSVC